jgi:hypothetical protein
MASATVMASGAKSRRARPASSTTGSSTAIVVSVEASTGSATALAPWRAASTGVSPLRRKRWIDSSTTTASSTRRPIASVRPPRVKELSVLPVA